MLLASIGQGYIEYNQVTNQIEIKKMSTIYFHPLTLDVIVTGRFSISIIKKSKFKRMEMKNNENQNSMSMI